MRRKVSETAIPPSSAPTPNAAALTRLDDPTCREAIARVALSGPGVATLREAQAELQPDYPDTANKLNELINALEAVTKALSAGAAWAQVGGLCSWMGVTSHPCSARCESATRRRSAGCRPDRGRSDCGIGRVGGSRARGAHARRDTERRRPQAAIRCESELRGPTDSLRRAIRE